MTERFARRCWPALLILTGFFFPRIAQGQDDQVVASPVFAPGPEIQAYWTPDRLARAKAMPLPTLSGSPRLGGSAPSEAAEGPLVLAGSGEPGARPTELTGAAAEAALGNRAGAPVPQFAPGSFAYTRYRLFPNTNGQYKKFPYSTMGQLLFTIPGQGDFVCSGASVSSTNQSVVWTAGHCVFTPGTGFHTNFLFIPARREGSSPFGTWTASQAFTTRQWKNGGQFEFDHGALVMNRGGTSGTARIGDAVGFLGFLANASREQQWSLHGWPLGARNLGQTPPGAQFDGMHHEICTAAFAATDDPSANGGALADGVGCDKTGGTSGGPWVVDFSGVGGATNFLNGNNSYRYTGPNPPENLKLFSPYFASQAVKLRNAAQAVPVP